MSNAFDKASLVMLPHAYEEGKLYSLKPTDRSGDFTFSRGADTATRVDVNGLIEKGRENLLLQSNQFDTTWTFGGVTRTGGQSGYDGTNNAWLITATNVSGVNVNQIVNTSGVKTYSIYAKAGTTNWIRMSFNDTGINSRAWFDLTNGVVGTIIGNVIDTEITSLGSSWYRCSISVNLSVNSPNLYMFVVDGNGVTSAAVGDSVYIQDAQLEQGLVASDVISTTTTSVSAGILEDMPRLDYSGGASCPSLLLEPQRTNLITHSEYLGGEFSLDNVSLDYNYGTSPEGVTNSALLTQTGSSSSNSMYEFNLPTTDGSYAYSFFFKAGTSTNCRMYVATGIAEDFNPQTITSGYSGGTLNILFEDYGDGWWRASATETLSGASTNRFSIYPDRGNQGRNVEIWGAQVEVGSYPTSYIPTYGSAQTRTSEGSAFELSVLDFFSLGTSESGTFFLETKFTKPSSQSLVDVFSQGGSGNNVWQVSNFQIRDTGGARNFIVQNIDTLVDDYIKIIIRKDLTTYNVFTNGVKSSTTATITNPLIWFDHIALYRNSQNVKQMMEFPTALSDSECIALTTL